MESAATKDVPWVEKYRPAHFDNIVLDPINRHFFRKIIEKKRFPHLLFYGPPGTGKTTTVINLIQQYQKEHGNVNKGNIIHLNASDERGIDIIRNQIYSFVKSNNMFEAGLKFVVLDEVDYMTKNAQQALKYLIQTTNTDVRFCLICNYISKIDTPLKNEFIVVRFNQLPTKDIISFIETIVENERIVISKEAIFTIQSMYKSDIRSMINFLQLNQHFKLDEWNKNILSPSILDDLHNMFYTNEQHITILEKIFHISKKYNIDKKHLLHNYFNHIVRCKLVKLNDTFFTMLCEIVHNVSANIDDIIFYMITNMATLELMPSPCANINSA